MTKVNKWSIIGLLPLHCALCLAPAQSKALCDDCHKDLPWLRVNHCTRCALPLEVTDSICGQCLQTPPPYDQCKALFEYQSPLDFFITQFKYQGDLALGKLLTQLFGTHFIDNAVTKPDALIPMPLHSSRLKERGFNQAALLAQHLSQQLNIPFHTDVCQRVRATGHQLGLSAKARKQNMRGAFECSKPLTGKSVTVIDDVVTTGTTITELANTLRKAGAARIDIWCIARTPTHLHLTS